MKYLGYIIVVLFVLVSCKPGIPSDVMSEGEMVDVLYDMHIAQAMSNDPDVIKNQKEVIALRASVLEKHGISQKEWKRSFQFYCGHADYMHEVYNDLDERLNDDVVALGGKAAGITDGEEADSTNIWNMESSILLGQVAPYNEYSFTITPDSTFHDGDRVNLQYVAQFIFQDGMRDVTVSMNIYYDRSSQSKSDSIATRTNHITSDGSGIISVSNDVDRLKVRKITGFFLLTNELSDNKDVGIRIAVIKDIKLLHQHSLPPAAPSQNTPQDSIRNDSSNNTRPGPPPGGPEGDRQLSR